MSKPIPAKSEPITPRLPDPAFEDPRHNLRLYQGDCLEILAAIPANSVDLIFADPPYFLSNGGITCHAGKMVSVHKGDWDKSRSADANHEFNRDWLAAAQRVLKPNGSIWVSGTAHVIHSVGFAMQQLGFKLLNDISWVKPNPPPNLSCRYFTHATETLIWAAKDKTSRHTFNYKLMKETNRGKQMKSVWEIRPPESWEKKFGKHPTQKPVALLERILLASTNEGDLVLDPFAGSSTTLIAAFRLRRQAVGCELTAEFLTLSLRRLCSNLVHAEISVTTLHFSVDPPTNSMDRSKCAHVANQLGSCSGRSSDRSAILRSARGPSRAGVRPGAQSFGQLKKLVIPSLPAEAGKAEGPAFSSFAVDVRSGPGPSRASRFSSGHGFSRAVRHGQSERLQPLRASLFDEMSPQPQLVQQERRFYFVGRTKREILFTALADSLEEARQKFRNAGQPESDALFIIKTETESYLT
jgi:site-specific DNA-methyltransferase (adenine-specific)